MEVGISTENQLFFNYFWCPLIIMLKYSINRGDFNSAPEDFNQEIEKP